MVRRTYCSEKPRGRRRRPGRGQRAGRAGRFRMERLFVFFGSGGSGALSSPASLPGALLLLDTATHAPSISRSPVSRHQASTPHNLATAGATTKATLFPTYLTTNLLTMSTSSKQKRKEHVQRQLDKQAFDKAQAALRPATEFLCPVEFRNSLPAPAADPKLVKIQQDAGQLTAYRNTSLVQGYVGKLHAAKDVGMCCFGCAEVFWGGVMVCVRQGREKEEEWNRDCIQVSHGVAGPRAVGTIPLLLHFPLSLPHLSFVRLILSVWFLFFFSLSPSPHFPSPSPLLLPPGVPLDLIDVQKYQPPEGPVPEMDPADARLVESAGRLGAGAAGGVQVGHYTRARPEGVTWLVRTEYIANDLYDPMFKMRTQKEEAEKRLQM